MTPVNTSDLIMIVREVIADLADLEAVHADDDLLGLDSLQLSELLEVVEDTWGADVAARLTMPDVQTLRSLAGALAAGQGGA
jgi:hypothetical protein